MNPIMAKKMMIFCGVSFIAAGPARIRLSRSVGSWIEDIR